jgi:transposase
MSSRIEVISRVSGRRRWTVEQKLAVLRDAFGPEGSVRAACERHDVGSGSIYTWRRQAMSGELTGVRKPIEPVFAEVQISEPPALPAPLVSSPISSSIGIDLPSGIRVTVDATVDADALSRVIGILTR